MPRDRSSPRRRIASRTLAYSAAFAALLASTAASAETEIKQLDHAHLYFGGEALVMSRAEFTPDGHGTGTLTVRWETCTDLGTGAGAGGHSAYLDSATDHVSTPFDDCHVKKAWTFEHVHRDALETGVVNLGNPGYQRVSLPLGKVGQLISLRPVNARVEAKADGDPFVVQLHDVWVTAFDFNSAQVPRGTLHVLLNYRVFGLPDQCNGSCSTSYGLALRLADGQRALAFMQSVGTIGRRKWYQGMIFGVDGKGQDQWIGFEVPEGAAGTTVTLEEYDRQYGAEQIHDATASFALPSIGPTCTRNDQGEDCASPAKTTMRYRIGALDLHDQAAELAIAQARSAVDRANSDVKAARDLAAAASAALHDANVRADRAGEALQHAEQALTMREGDVARLDGRVPPDRIAAKVAKLKAAHDDVEAARTVRDGALAAQQQALSADRDARDTMAVQVAELAGLKVKQLDVERRTALDEIDVTADGQIVFKATAVLDRLVQLTGPLDQLIEEARAARDQARAEQTAAEATLLEASRVRADANAERQRKLLKLGNTRFLVTFVKGIKDAVEGAGEGGPWGALASTIKFALKEKIGAAFAGDQDLEAQLAKALDAHGGDAGDLVGEIARSQLTKLAASPLTDSLEALSKPLKEDLAAYAKSAIFGEPMRGLDRMSRSIGTRARVAKELSELMASAKALRDPKVWKALIQAKGLEIIDPKGIAADVVTDAAAATLEQRAKMEVAQAFAAELVAGRVEQLDRKAYEEISRSYRELEQEYAALVATEQSMLAQAKLAAAKQNAGFATALDVPFDEGATLVVTSKPGLASFSFLRGSIGDATTVYDAKAGGLTATATHLAPDGGGRPRAVTVALSFGGAR
jgi:hypothetical protein